MAGTHDHVTAAELQLAGLGRPFSLGMLYDCRSDKLIPSYSLWDKANLERDVVTKPQLTSAFSIITDDIMDSKANALDIQAGLKLSVLGGLVSVSGSAKYLHDRKSSEHQFRETMKYKCTTEFKQLSMTHVAKENIQYRDVLDHGQATHVVTGILYGAHAFLVFDKHLSDEEMNNNVEGELHVLVKNLPQIQIDGKGSVKLTEDEKKTADQLKVQFYGDFVPSVNPTTYADAVKLYKELPNQLGQKQEKAVPVKVWLTPLKNLGSNAAQLVREISANLVRRTGDCIEQFHTLNTKCNDLCSSHACRSFQGIRGKISKFRVIVNHYEDVFTKQLMSILPKIRGGGAEESDLQQLIQIRERSPFNHSQLDQWLNNCAAHIRLMEKYISRMKSVKRASNPGDLCAAIMDPACRHCVCFNFQLNTDDKQQSAMEACLNKCNEFSSESVALSVSDETSFFDRLKKVMAANCRTFIDFHKANADRSGTTFIVAEDTKVTDTPGAFIRLYFDGELVDGNFKPPSKPGEPREHSSTHDELEITWKQPDTGLHYLTHYIVSYKTFGSDEWTNADTKGSKPTFTISKLIPATLYQIKVTVACEAGNSLDSDISVIATRPTNPPAKPMVRQASDLKIEMEWARPTIIGEEVKIKSYYVERCPMTGRDKEKWVSCGFTEGTKLSCYIRQEVDTPFRYRLVAHSEKRKSLPSDASEAIAITARMNLKERVRAYSKKESIKNLSLLQVPLKKVTANTAAMVRKITFGEPNPGVPEKVILIVGATGAGKTTFINGIVNYVLGVEWEDDFRFRLVQEDDASNQAESQTQWISAYTLHYQKDFQIPFTLTVVDTPGFGDTTGIERDRKITGQLRHFFSTTGDGGIDHIDAVGFVMQASLPRLTPSQKYIFDSILSLFGKDIVKNIFLLITFGDGKKPPVLAGVKKAGLPYEKYFQFNNSALFASNVKGSSNDHGDDDDDTGDNGEFDEMFWKMGVGNYKKFLDQLKTISGQSLTLTKSVLDERNRLELVVSGIQTQIQTGIITLEQLKTEVEVLKSHKADIKKNRNFTYTVQEEKVIQIDNPDGSYSTNCVQCNFTCHYPCSTRNDSAKLKCTLMCPDGVLGILKSTFKGLYTVENGHCMVCPGRCFWKMHRDHPYRFETKLEDVKKTSADLKARYESAKDKSMSSEKLIEKVLDDLTAVRMQVLSMTNEVRKLINHLKEIALKPNPLSAVEYIDILIESERNGAMPGWLVRVSHLTKLRKEAEILAQLEKEGYEPFEEYQKILEEAKEATKEDGEGGSGTSRVPKWIRKAKDAFNERFGSKGVLKVDKMVEVEPAD